MPDIVEPLDGQKSAAPKKRKNSKAKGNGFEGLVAKKLTAALQPLNFIRTPGSGARVGGKNFETIGQMFGEDALKIFVGDVVPVNERQEKLKFLWSIECKSYASADSFTSLVAGSALIFKWFQEAVDDAEKVDKAPMTIFKWNRTDIFVAVDAAHVRQAVAPRLTLTTYGPQARTIDIFYLDDLLQVPAIWTRPGV